ncbi:MAG: hypothetical protein IM665_03185 [Phenylobacterium sp.]|nr:hypothetical protein [Phenylobacterium sp.]
MLYQRKTLPDTNIGDPAPLPAELVGLSDASLADLSAAVPEAAQELGYAGQGFFPVVPDPPPPPPPSRVLNKVDFARLFTQAERIAIDDAANINSVVRDYDRMLNRAPNVNLDDPDVQTGVPLLELGGLIGVGRAAQILAGEAP